MDNGQYTSFTLQINKGGGDFYWRMNPLSWKEGNNIIYTEKNNKYFKTIVDLFNTFTYLVPETVCGSDYLSIYSHTEKYLFWSYFKFHKHRDIFVTLLLVFVQILNYFLYHFPHFSY